MKIKNFISTSLFAVIFAIVFTLTATAQTIVVTPGTAATQGWSQWDTRTGGTSGITAFPDGSGGNGSLHLTTDSTNAAKADYMHAANVPLGDITQLSYSTYQNNPPSPANADASYQLPVCLGGFDTAAVTLTNPSGCVGFTTLVFEPYQSNGICCTTITPNTWESWDVDAGKFWSSRTYNDLAGCSVSAGAGGAPFYTLSGLSAACSDAVVVGFGVNVGSYNPNYDVYADFVNFNGTTYNFEAYQVPSSAEQCKNGGWVTLKRTGGVSGFKNQGDCIQFVNTGN